MNLLIPTIKKDFYILLNNMVLTIFNILQCYIYHSALYKLYLINILAFYRI